MAGWLRVVFLLVLVIKVDQHVTMNSVRRKQYKHQKVGDQQHQIEAVDLIKALKSLVQKMGTDVLANPVVGKKHSRG